MAVEERQYGLWDSPIPLDLLCQNAVTLEAARACRKTAKLYILEGRSDGRNVIVELDGDGSVSRDVLPAPYSVGTKVHEYGGAGFVLDSDLGTIFFSDLGDRGVYSLNLETGEVESIIEHDGWRFADFSLHPSGLLAAVRERHDLENDTPETVVNELVLIHTRDGKLSTLVSGSDFYSHVRFSLDGSRISWLEWQHPEMPWTGSRLFAASFNAANGAVDGIRLVAGSGRGRSISQPRWGPDGTLFFADDVSGVWQIYTFRKDDENAHRLHIHGLEGVEHAGAEFRLGTCTYLPMSKDKLMLTYHDQAIAHFVIVDIPTGKPTSIPLPIVEAPVDAVSQINKQEFLIIGNLREGPTSLYHVDISANTSPVSTLLRQTLNFTDLKPYISLARPLTSPRTTGSYRQGSVQSFLYLPYNPSYTAPRSTLPPLLAIAHGGPTGHYKPSLDLSVQYWTSRGYAVALVNYAGSTGYGLAYRTLLDGRWGDIDAADTASVALHLAARGVVDRSRLGVYGLSAGGFIVLKTLCDAPAVWAAGVSLFGVSDTKAFSAATHKFEHHYADRLLFGDGGLAGDEQDAVHRDRSPLFHAGSVRAATLIQQGDQDTIVVPQQALDMEAALRKEGKVKDLELEMFAGEGHAFWRGQAQRRMITSQERWWRKFLLRHEAL
ncbi:putative dipeptidyl peptidase IV [Polychaeton citri CBS 116435]|uniref:Dipeptidyl peptidase IV n=1 Tax=Polychaeton citri CBS 116435 TaxID=1314669 RepID=A0A9P4UI29_9PEZI|nr:putative dipeptidyl peptidase IV [Polychaeton citri CBS 116435]